MHLKALHAKMEIEAKLQQKWACLASETGPFLRSHWHILNELGSALGFTEDQFASVLLSSDIVCHHSPGKLGFRISKFKSAMCNNVNSDAEADVVCAPTRCDNLNQFCI